MREQYLRIKNDKLLYLTSEAGERIGERVDVYEYGNVMALVGNGLGYFHAGAKSSGCRGKNICSEELVAYLRRKYGMEHGGRLPVWQAPGEEGRVLLFGGNLTPEESDCRLDGRFQKLELGYRKRYGEWVFIEDNCISFTAGVRRSLPRQMALYQTGETLALLSDPQGPYALEYRDRKQDAIYNRRLAEYCKARFNCTQRGMRLHAVEVENGVCFALAEELLPRTGQCCAPERVDLGLPQDRFISRLKTESFYISSRAARKLGGRVSVYTADGFLALKGEPRGQLTLHAFQYTNLIHSGTLCKVVEARYPARGRLYLYGHGDLLVLLRDAGEAACLPPPEHFRLLDVAGKQPPLRTGRSAERLCGFTNQNTDS